MNSIYRILAVFIIPVVMGISLSCTDDELGSPMVRYVRITDPNSSDSLLVAAGQGQMIAIMGNNLGDVRQVWFNDQQAVLTPTFITNTTIITRVPSQIPTEITNMMKLIFGNGSVLEYDFSVDISEPYIARMVNEYTPIGSVATIYGDYFYEPLTVTFAGGVEGELIEVEDQMIRVEVPAGAEPGSVVITTNFGETVSDFWYHDNRNIIASFDGTMNGVWHGPNYITSSDPDIPAIDGKFIRMNRDLGAWGWFELYVGPANSDVALELKNIPEDAFTNPEDYSLKFEMMTLEPFVGAPVRLYLGPDMPGERGGTNYQWNPNVDTGGEWQTQSIPWADIYHANKDFAYNANGYGISFHFSGPNPTNGNFGMDNLRVVPNIID